MKKVRSHQGSRLVELYPLRGAASGTLSAIPLHRYTGWDVEARQAGAGMPSTGM